MSDPPRRAAGAIGRRPERLRPHHRFATRVRLDAADVADFARRAGDTNPLHHDREVAARSRYGGLIASGPQTSALLMGLAASHCGRFGPMVGLEFRFRFLAGVPVDEECELEWLVIRSEPRPGRTGELIELRGRLRTAAGVTAVGAAGTLLVQTAD